MNKKGSNTLVLVAGELVFVALVIFVFINLTGAASNPFFSQQVVTAEDVARTLSVAQATPYDFYYDYPETLDNHYVLIKEGEVTLKQKTDNASQANFILNNRRFTYINNFTLPDNKKVDVSYFYVRKEGDEIIVGDFTKKEKDPILKISNLKKPNISISYEEVDQLSQNIILKKLSSVMKSEIFRSDFKTGDTNLLNIKITIIDKDESDSKNVIYYSTTKEKQTSDLANNLQEVFSDDLKVSSIPLAKDYGQDAVVEIAIVNSRENLELFSDDSYQRRAGQMFAEVFKLYYE